MEIPKEKITEDTLNNLLDVVDKDGDIREKFKIKPENFKTKFDLICYLNALKLVTTEEDTILPFLGPPSVGKSLSAISMAIRMIEILKTEFYANIPDFNIEKDIEYKQISPQEMAIKMKEESHLFMIFDRVLLQNRDVEEFGFPAELRKNPEGTWLYFTNMKNKLHGYKKFEGDVKNLLLKTFIYDIIFLNPVINSSKKEFSDILITFFGSDLIIQCKESNLADQSRLIKSTIVAGLKQLNTSVNRVNKRDVKLSMVNSNKIYKDYDFSEVVDIYPLLIVNKKPQFFSYEDLKKEYPFLNKLNFFPIILTYDELNFVLTELDTPKDLFRYLKGREAALKTGKILFKDEIQLFLFYLLNNKSFKLDTLLEYEKTLRLENILNIYEQSETYLLYLKKRDIDKVSYDIDKFIRHLHLSDQPNYLEMAEELSKLDRNERRYLAQQAYQKREQSIKDKRRSWRMFYLDNNPDVCFVLYFTNQPEKETVDFLFLLCATAKYITKTKKVIGLAQTTFYELYLLFNVACILTRIEPYTPKEEASIKEIADEYWSKDFRIGKYGEFY